MGKKLYVGNIPFTITNEQLKEAFTACGNVESANIIIDKASGRSKGFGFVVMMSDDEARAAIDQMNGKDVGGRQITVAEARPQPEREFSPRGGGGGGGGGGRRFGGGGGGRGGPRGGGGGGRY